MAIAMTLTLVAGPAGLGLAEIVEAGVAGEFLVDKAIEAGTHVAMKELTKEKEGEPPKLVEEAMLEELAQVKELLELTRGICKLQGKYLDVSATCNAVVPSLTANLQALTDSGHTVDGSSPSGCRAAVAALGGIPGKIAELNGKVAHVNAEIVEINRAAQNQAAVITVDDAVAQLRAKLANEAFKEKLEAWKKEHPDAKSEPTGEPGETYNPADRPPTQERSVSNLYPSAVGMDARILTPLTHANNHRGRVWVEGLTTTGKAGVEATNSGMMGMEKIYDYEKGSIGTFQAVLFEKDGRLVDAPAGSHCRIIDAKLNGPNDCVLVHDCKIDTSDWNGQCTPADGAGGGEHH
jgi:hypothetical protein